MAKTNNVIEDIRKAIHKEVDKLLDEPNLISFKITFSAGRAEALTATVEKKAFLQTEDGTRRVDIDNNILLNTDKEANNE